MQVTKKRISSIPIVFFLSLLSYSTPVWAAVLYPTGTYNSTGSSVSIVKTNYTRPTGAKYVSTSGSDSTGNGSLSSPWRTIAKAIASTGSGGTIVIRGGNYHESVRIVDKKLTLQPYPGESVWFKGSSTITGWVQETSTLWRKDNYTFTAARNKPGGYPNTTWPYPDVVLVNGVGLKQVSFKSSVSAGEFYIDQANNKLYIGTSPSGKTVEAATLEMALDVRNINSTSGANGSIIRGIGFKHYATFVDDGGALLITAAKVQILDCTFAWNGGRGLFLYKNADGIVRGNTMAFNGEAGLYAGYCDRLLIERNAFAYNVQKPWTGSWSAGGAKLWKARNMVSRDNLAEQNSGKGLWLDESALDAIVVRNTLRFNRQMGIQFEVSAGGVIASNLIYNNNERGILISSSGASYTMKMYVYNNTLLNNKTGDIRVWETERANNDSTGLSQGITYNVSGVQVKNNLLVNSVAPQFFTSDDRTNRKSSSQMIESMDYNGYWRKSSTTTKNMILWTKYVGQLPVEYTSVGAFKSNNVPYESHALVYNLVSTDPFFYNSSAGDFRLKCGSTAIGRGTSLPSQVASALGVSTGVNQNLGALLGVAGCTSSTTASMSAAETALAESTSDITVPEANLVSVEASADAYVQDGEHAATNYGSEPTLLAKTAAVGLNRMTYLKFDISQVSGSIQNAKLRIYARLDREGALESEIFGVPDQNWSEEDLTWDNHPGVSVNLGKVLVEGSTYQVYEIDLTDYIKQEKAAGSQSVGIAFSNPAGSTPQIQINSREAESNAPELVIQTGN